MGQCSLMNLGDRRRGTMFEGCRRYMVGEAMGMGNPSAQKYWTLPEIIERMQSAYCNTLTAEFDHLPLQ